MCVHLCVEVGGGLRELVEALTELVDIAAVSAASSGAAESPEHRQNGC